MKFTLQKVKQSIIQNPKKQKIIAFISTDRTLGQSTFVANLGLLFSRTNRRVLLIDLDYEHNSFETAFNINSAKTGLYESFTKLDNYRNIITTVDSNKMLDVIISGDESSVNLKNRSIQSDFSNLLAQIEDNYDYIFINCRPVRNTKSSISVVQLADTSVLTCELGTTNKRQIYQLAKTMLINNYDVLGYVSIERVEP